MTPDDLKHFWSNHVKIQADDEHLDPVKAKDIATERAAESAANPMLLSWYNRI
ncbi:MAG: AF1514 family protein [Desulfobacterales bacterium]|jgi:hypothetical protein